MKHENENSNGKVPLPIDALIVGGGATERRGADDFKALRVSA
jgi:hypothetical protein